LVRERSRVQSSLAAPPFSQGKSALNGLNRKERLFFDVDHYREQTLNSPLMLRQISRHVFLACSEVRS
jgi:hypothetical protein